MANKLTLVNKTKWDTRDLRRFVLAGLKAEVGTWGNYKVTIRYQQSSYGNGYIGWREMMIAVPRPEGKVGSNGAGGTLVWPASHGDSRDEEGCCTLLFMSDGLLRRMAITLAHEADHNKGTRGHRDIDDSERDVAWVDELLATGFQINIARPKKKAKRDLPAERHAHAKAMLADHERKLAREKKLTTKWRRKVRYYDRAIEKKKAARKA